MNILQAAPPGQCSCRTRKGSGGAVGHSTKLPASMEKSFLFLRRDLRAHPSPVVSPACSGPFSTRLWAPQPLGPSCAEPPSCHQQDVPMPFSTTKPEVRASVSCSPCTQHQPSPSCTPHLQLGPGVPLGAAMGEQPPPDGEISSFQPPRGGLVVGGGKEWKSTS